MTFTEALIHILSVLLSCATNLPSSFVGMSDCTCK